MNIYIRTWKLLKFYFYAWKCRLFCIFMIIPNPLSTLFFPAFVCLLSVFTILLTLKTDREQFNKKYELVNLWKSYVMIFLRFSLFSNFLSIAFTSSHQKKIFKVLKAYRLSCNKCLSWSLVNIPKCLFVKNIWHHLSHRQCSMFLL